MSRHALVEPRRPTQAERADQAVRGHLAALVIIIQQGDDDEVCLAARSEICRLVSAVCTALSPHRLDSRGHCALCGPDCELLNRLSRALLPVRL
ncbi:hypothetical protein [Actinokineospora sp.]|uniref:hypothetical protein n=1 Tax=Actinokineospora sp. TaxID=1872133 RepID=UPI003D6AFF84